MVVSYRLSTRLNFVIFFWCNQFEKKEEPAAGGNSFFSAKGMQFSFQTFEIIHSFFLLVLLLISSASM
jgi:hypothetical protein